MGVRTSTLPVDQSNAFPTQASSAVQPTPYVWGCSLLLEEGGGQFSP